MQDQILCQVYTTTDYEKFKPLAANRPVNKVHVRRIRDSLYLKRLVCPIIVNEKLEIIDGQHRYSALKEAMMPIDYIIVNGYGIYEVQVLNTNMKNWSQIDYLNAFCEMGVPSYLLLKKFLTLYPHFSIKSAGVIIRGSYENSKKVDKNLTGTKSGSIKLRPFEEGDFEFPNFEIACERANTVMEFKDIYPYFSNDKFIRSVIHMTSIAGYDNQRMVDKLSSYGGPYKIYANTKQFLEFLEDVYNYRMHTKVGLRML